MQINQLDALEFQALTVASMVTAWLAVAGLLSVLSGWPRLARRFPTAEKPHGIRLWGQVTWIGWLVDNRITYLTVSPIGLYLSALFMFRFMHRPILVPWPDVRYISAHKTLWWNTYVFDLGGITRIRVKEQAFHVIKPFLRDAFDAESQRTKTT